MSSARSTNRHWVIPLALLAAAALACSPVASLFGEEPSAAERVATLEVQLENARATASAEAAESAERPAEVEGGTDGETGPAESQPSVTVEEDFEAGTQAFELGEGTQVTDGGLLLGPYEQCANDVANFDQPVNCLVVCTACGQGLAEYRMSFGFTFEEGLSDREFGVMLRLVDEDGDRMLDREDYLLALGFSIYDNRWRLYFHEPDQIEPWDQIARGQAGFLTPGRLNQVAVQAVNGGRDMTVDLNDARILTLTGEEPEPGERWVQPWADAGEVGFLGLGRGVTARFDNFTLETGP